jgi:glycosyltransferase involved in cell wall biosynthesis
MKIGVFIPVHNEARAIAGLVTSLRAKGLPVVVVDDGSTDLSGHLARQAGATVLVNERKSGKGFSLRRAFDYARANGYDGVITLDGDGQHSVSDVDLFLNVAGDDRAVVITGNRMGNTRTMPLVRYIVNRFMSMIISCACRQSIPDTQCGYRYIGTDVLAAVSFTSGDFEIETEILIKAHKKGFRILSVPVQTIYQDEKSKINPFKDTIRFIRCFIREICSR